MKEDKIEKTVSNFNIGDQVMFKTEGVNNYNLYWKVIGFFEDHLHLEIDDMAHQDKRYIHPKDIIIHTRIKQ